jgi:5'-nucleotidase
MYKKWIVILVAIFLLSCSTATKIPTEFRLTILHTNDLHGRIENMPQYSTIVQMVRAENVNLLLLDGGDLYRRGPYQQYRGAVEVEILNFMGYNAMVFGNNDFPSSDRELYNIAEHTILQNANFPVLCSNVTKNGEYISGMLPYMIETFDGLRVAIIGVTSTKPRDRGYDFTKRYLLEDPIPALDRLVAKTSEYSDIQLALSHAGFHIDMNMRSVSAIIGADSHIKLSSPFIVMNDGVRIPIVQAGGETDNYLGRLDLVYTRVNNQWVLKDFNGFLYSLEDVVPDTEIIQIINKYDESLRQYKEAS